MTTRASDPKVRAAERWTAFGDRLRSITPETLARTLIGVAAVAMALWLTAASWPALAPFVAGVVIAYAVLPIANRLDRYMPRVLAALIAELIALAALAGVVVLIVPPILRGLVRLAGILPTRDQVSAALDGLQTSLGTLQEPIRGIVLAVATQTAANLQAALDGLVNGAANFVTTQILGLAGTASFVLGLLVIPAWVLTLVADERSIKRRATGVIAPGLRADAVALARIVDRAFSTFIRIRVLLAIVASALIFAGLEVAGRLGIQTVDFTLTAATLLGVLQLIPELGFFLGFFPILLVLAVVGPVPALTIAAVYWVSVRIASGLVETRVSRGVLDVHPGLLIPGIVVLSQFGLLWLLAAAPVIAVARDTVRYLVGRMADPPQPAGVIPGERRARRSMIPASVPIPTAYRSVVAPRRAAAPARAPAERTVPALPEPAFVPSTAAMPSILSSVTERSIAS